MINELQLRQEITDRIKKLNSEQQRELQNGIEGVAPGRLASIMGNMTSATPLTDRELYLVAFKIIPDFNPKNYFGDREIEEYKSILNAQDERQARFPLEFEKCLQVNDEQYVTTISIKEINELYSLNILNYDHNTQRDPRIKTKDNKIVREIKLNRSSVKQIKNLLLQGRFIPNAMTWNVKSNNESDVWDYDEDNQLFVVKKYGFNIIDGWHRLVAITQAITENKNLEIIFPLYIMVFNDEKAQSYIAQEDKRNKIDPNYSRSLDNTKFENRVIKSLNSDPDFVFYNKMVAVGSGKFNLGKAITALEPLFKIHYSKDSYSEARNLKNYLMSHINLLIETYPELEDAFGDLELRISFCCLHSFYDDPNLTYIIYSFLRYFAQNKQELLHTSTRMILKTIDAHKEEVLNAEENL